MPCGRRFVAVAVAALCAFAAGVAAATPAAAVPSTAADAASLGPYNVDMGAVTVGGLSSGAFMAVQCHVAFSSFFKAASVFAGGPYGCAVGNVVSALTFCEKGPIPPVAVAATVANTKLYYSTGLIDNPSNLANSSVYLFSGINDDVVAQAVVKATKEFYQAFVTTGTVASEFDLHANHLMPTLVYGEQCAVKGSPYIGKCAFDGAGAALATIASGPLKPVTNTTTNTSNVVAFSQSAFFKTDPSLVGLAQTGYAYVPTACQQGALCSVHVELHGCLQNVESVGMQYVLHAGFNPHAEANNIMVVYPQTTAIDVLNPESCWDWWGFTGEDYLTRDAVQISYIRRLVESLATGTPTAV